LNKNDLRVIKTRQNIRNTFIRLLSEKEFEDITVQELIDRAVINRSTFYKHFRDKYDLAESMCSEFMDQYRCILEERASTLNPGNLFLGVDKLFEKLTVHRETILALSKIHTERVHVFDDMQDLLRSIARDIISKLTGKEASEYQLHLLSVIMITNLRYLLESKDAHAKEKIISELNFLMRALGDLGKNQHSPVSR